jgi:hypothetical protein
VRTAQLIRSGLIVGTYLTEADGHAERDAALMTLYEMRKRSCKPMTVAADKANDAMDCERAACPAARYP